MNKFEQELTEFFNAWKSDKHSRYLSWGHCYHFFLDNKSKILNEKYNNKENDLLDIACLHLSFYLASWGMYRGSSNILWKDYKIHKNLITELIKKCANLWKDTTWEQLEKAKNIIKDCYSEYGITATDTLITKVLLSIFGCIPAYDNFFKEGLRLYNKEHNKNIPLTFNEDSFNELKTIAKPLNLHEDFKNYPPMRLIDAYFWWTGGGKEAHEKHANI